jgi:hypothetical protein
MKEDVTIIVVNWNGVAFLDPCLRSIRKQEYPSFSTILVDNGSTDASLDHVKMHFPEVSIIELPSNTGFAYANNVALSSVQTEYAALLNNDAVAHPLWLQTLVEALDKNPSAGFAASKMVFLDQPGIIDRAGDVYTKAGTGWLRGRGKPASLYNRKEWIFGACAGAALYRMEMLHEIGLFDEDFFLLYEDVDLSFRAQWRGYKCVYVPEAIAYHKGSGSIIQDSPMSIYYSHRNLEWVYMKNVPFQLILLTIVYHLIYDIAAILYFIFKGNGKYIIKAKWDAIRKIKIMLIKRGQIQKNRRIKENYIWRLMKNEYLIPRLLGRRNVN